MPSRARWHAGWRGDTAIGWGGGNQGWSGMLCATVAVRLCKAGGMGRRRVNSQGPRRLIYRETRFGD